MSKMFMRATSTQMLAATATILGLVAASGCATKKHVRTVVQPVETRVATLENKNTTNEKAIAELERGVARLDETSKAIEQKALEAQRSAKEANEAAAKVDVKADNALATAAAGRKLAEQGIDKLTDVEKQILGLDNYKLSLNEAVLFDLGKDTLTKDAKELLDSIAAKATAQNRFVVEIQGFTDSTGSRELNLALSQRRAEAVLRYLTMEHKVPLHRVSVLGAGAENPVADNKTSAGRKQNRRVEVRVFSSGSAGEKASGNGTSVSKL